MRFRRRGAEFWRATWLEYEKSGQSRAAFAQARGLSEGTLSRWVRRFRASKPATRSKSFVPVVVAKKGETAGEGVLVEVMLPNGVGLRFEVGSVFGVVEVAAHLGEL